MPVTGAPGWRAGETKGWTSALVPVPWGAGKKDRGNEDRGGVHEGFDKTRAFSRQAGIAGIGSVRVGGGHEH